MDASYDTRKEVERDGGGNMAKVSVDKDLCTGCGLCVSSCPDVFELREEDNIAIVKAENCESCDLSQVTSDCPVEAIKAEE